MFTGDCRGSDDLNKKEDHEIVGTKRTGIAPVRSRIKNAEKSPFVERFAQHALIYSSKCGGIFQATHRSTGIELTAKIFRKDSSTRESTQSQVRRGYKTERATLKKIQHNSILKYRGWGEDETSQYLLFEGGVLSSFRTIIDSSLTSMNETEVIRIFGQIFSALELLHKKGHYHGAVRAESVLQMKDGSIRLTNFEISKRQMLFWGNMSGREEEEPDPYKAPLERSWKKEDARKGDMWSCGVLMFYFLTRRLPHHSLAVTEKGTLNCDGTGNGIPAIGNQAATLLFRLLEADSTRRFTASEAVEWCQRHFYRNEHQNV